MAAISLVANPMREKGDQTMAEYVGALDQGTTSNRFIIFDHNGRIIGMETWIIWWLTGGPRNGSHVTDVTNASRTMLMDLNTLDWDEEILQIIGIPRQILPRIVPSSDSKTWGVTLKDGPLGACIPLCGALGDQQAALMGQTCFDLGEAKNTYGTGCFLLLNTGHFPVLSRHGLLTTLGYQISDQPPVYCLEGSIAISGALVQWLRETYYRQWKKAVDRTFNWVD
jgi:glycerol kinase